MIRKLEEVSGKYGAPMGRQGYYGAPDGQLIHIQHVPLDEGYDDGGAYWGCGQPLWWAYDDDGEYEAFFRASNREAAKNVVLDEIPDAKFDS